MSDNEKITIPYIYNSQDTPFSKGTSGSAAYDLSAAEDGTIMPDDCLIVNTGISTEVPTGYYLQIVPRSGLSAQSDVSIRNSPGIIDSDYRGKIGIILRNTGKPYIDLGILIASSSAFSSILLSIIILSMIGVSTLNAVILSSLLGFFQVCFSLTLLHTIMYIRSFSFKKGDRLAQLLICKSYEGEFVSSRVLSQTDRGTGGFGSTGR